MDPSIAYCCITTPFQPVLGDYCHRGSAVVLLRSDFVAKGPRKKVQFDLNAETLQKVKWLQ